MISAKEAHELSDKFNFSKWGIDKLLGLISIAVEESATKGDEMVEITTFIKPLSECMTEVLAQSLRRNGYAVSLNYAKTKTYIEWT